ncbi:ligase-associated DNA damage response endonuclease PdeM [Rhodanobacter sp. L36]|uniref:ligase-associated DNA damage response endonuclease PdeM n=1 Tax=Rhodanobacter sp. L36 TaxID=1747221 RepID=UPI00131B2E60|nr:ligase-associated DNA damage response endonuclease PdeM [Rhodanobacter sp. L36]
MNELRMRIAGESWTLHAERAMYWPRHKALLVTDVHFGKGSVLRRAGLAVPTGQTSGDLARLDALIAHYEPQRVFVLGDLVHGAAPLDAPWIRMVSAWRQRHAAIAMILIAGNHDRHFDARELGFEVITESLRISDIVLRHAPGEIDGCYVLAGHVHPGVLLHDGWRRHRLPAFRFDEHCGLLPAFGTLTGLHETPPAPGERIVAVTPAGLVPMGP